MPKIHVSYRHTTVQHVSKHFIFIDMVRPMDDRYMNEAFPEQMIEDKPIDF